jgi:hypothetical protein
MAIDPTAPHRARYNPFDWYWLADDGRIFASASGSLVEGTDPSYVTWLAGERLPTPWPRDDEGEQTDAALQEVLAPYGLFATLESYAADRRWRIETSGITLSGMPVRTDRESQALINGAFALAKDDPDTVIQFKGASGFVMLDAAAILAVGRAVAAHVQAAFAKEADVLADIADGTITTREQVDAAFAA